MKRCPACSEVLFRRRIESTEIDGCPACGGLWLDKGELHELAREPRLLRLAGDAAQPGMSSSVAVARTNACPVCAQPLVAFEFDQFRGIRLDRCKACGGIWLDHGEARAIADRLDPPAAPPVAPSPAADPQPAPEPSAPPVAPAPAPSMTSDGLELAYDPYAGRTGAEPAEIPPPVAPVSEPAGAPSEASSAYIPGLRAIPIGRLASVGFLVLLLVWWLWPTRLAQVPLKASPAGTEGTDPCEGKERCVVVVVAPWCPACKAALPIVKGMQKRFESAGTVGLKPVIAYAEEPKLLEMAKLFGGQVFLDPKGALLEEMGGGNVPHWFVVDRSGKVLEESAGVYGQLEAQLDELDLDDL